MLGAKEREGRPMGEDAIADEVLSVLGTARQIAPPASRDSTFDLIAAYRVARKIGDLREARGESPVGRKIGLTNRAAWADLKVSAPIWAYLYAATTHDLGASARASLAGLSEPRIEPEIVIGLAAPPRPGMDERELSACVAWVAHGFEIVRSIYPGWKFAPADAVAGFGMHGGLWIGPRHSFAERASAWIGELPVCEVELCRDGALSERGRGANVLDGPLAALRALVAVLAADADSPPLAAGEIVTTGSLTRAPPIAPDEVWETRISGIPLEGARLALME
jgi:2-oxo-3-hexenedioate decarboxylase